MPQSLPEQQWCWSLRPLCCAGSPRMPHLRLPAEPAPLLQPLSSFTTSLRGRAAGLIQSSLRDPDGSATDQYAWDGFTLGWTQTITEVQWRGGYHPALLGSGGPVFDFTVDIYASIPGGSQPDIAHPPLVHYQVGGNASEAASEVLGGVQTYDYRFVLPAPFQAAAATKYWVQIEAFQSGAPDWGSPASMSGDGYYFRHLAEEGTYQLVPGDASFTLLGPGTAAYRVYLPEVVRG